MGNFNTQSIQQVDRFLRKVSQKFISDEEPSLITDIHLRASQDSGDLMAFDDNENEISRCVVEEWIENKNDDFFEKVTATLRARLNNMADIAENLCLLKPYSFILENEDKEHVAELFVADDDISIIRGDIMQGWDKDLDDFFDKLMKE